MSDKIQLHHLQRKAVLHIRQSSIFQVTHNVESQNEPPHDLRAPS